MHSLIVNNKFDSIVHHIPVRGHSYLPCDRHFAQLEKIQRQQDILETCNQWINLFSDKFTVVTMTGRDIYDYKTELSKSYKKSVTCKGKKLMVSNTKLYKYSKEHKMFIVASENMSGFISESYRLIKPKIEFVQYPTEPMYFNMLPVKDLKLANVIKLKKYLGQPAKDHIDSLIGSNNVEDDVTDN